MALGSSKRNEQERKHKKRKKEKERRLTLPYRSGMGSKDG
jgi:hypothetical protein